MPYHPGDYYMFCARTGRKTLRSQMVKQWDGQWVRKGYEDPKHPRDYPMYASVPEVIRDTRSEPEDLFVEPGDVTASDF